MYRMKLIALALFVVLIVLLACWLSLGAKENPDTFAGYAGNQQFVTAESTDLADEAESSDDELFARAALMACLYDKKLELETLHRDMLRAVRDKQGADSAADSCAEAFIGRKVLDRLIARLFPFPEDRYEAVLLRGSYAIEREFEVDAECRRLRSEPNDVYGSEKLASVLNGERYNTLSMERLQAFLTETESLLNNMESYCVTEKGDLYPFYSSIAEISRKWEEINALSRPMSHPEWELYEDRMNRMVLALNPMVLRYKQGGSLRDSLSACARLLPPLRRAIAVEMCETFEEHRSVAKSAVIAAEKVSALLKAVRDAESARAVLPELQQAAGEFRALQKEHQEFFTTADALMWPEILKLRLLHHELVQTADALRAVNHCLGYPDLEQLLNEITRSWIPN
ncbi:MAG: hypothetical protein IJB89_04340 [Akkermansia sp.]|nr:hypothetical protein [Akkermansia sp.]